MKPVSLVHDKRGYYCLLYCDSMLLIYTLLKCYFDAVESCTYVGNKKVILA